MNFCISKMLPGIVAILLTIHAIGQQRNIDYFTGAAIANSPLLKDLSNQQLSLAVDSALVRAALKPQVNANSSNLYAPVINGYGYDDAITNGAQVSALVSVSKDFISKATLATRFKDLLLQQQIAANTSAMTVQDVKKMIVDQYLLTYGEQLQIEFSARINNLLAGEDSLLRDLTRRTVYKQTDYLLFTVSRQQQLLISTQQQVQYNSDYALLNYLAGITDTTIQRLESPDLSAAGIPELSASVFYKQFQLDSLKLINDKAVVDINYRPRINAFADAGYNSSLVYQAGRNFGTSVGLGVSIPIYDGKQRKLQYAKIDLQEKTRIGKRDYFIRQREQQLIQLNRQLQDLEKLIPQIESQVKYTETLITANFRLMETGDIRLPDFVLSLNNYLDAKNLLTQNFIDRMKVINQINYWNR
ncbi:MAG: TolC family protein [Chitinophagaceae bacterium]